MKTFLTVSASSAILWSAVQQISGTCFQVTGTNSGQVHNKCIQQFVGGFLSACFKICCEILHVYVCFSKSVTVLKVDSTCEYYLRIGSNAWHVYITIEYKILRPAFYHEC